MKMIRLNFLVAILVAIITVSGCKKDSDSGSKPPVPAVGADAQIVKIPTAMQNSTNTNVQTINSYATMANAFCSMSALFSTAPANAEVTDLKSTGKSWTWTVSSTYNNQTISFTYWIEYYEETTGYSWKLYVQGNTEYLTKTLVVEAYQDLTASTGWLKIYSPDQTAAVITFTWTKTGSDISATLLYNYDGNYLYYAFTSAGDGSGTLKVYYGSTSAALKIVDATWTSSGTGTWWFKNPDTLVVTSGSF
jgi:hypothetical protein